ncbi:MAG: pilus assembly PilX N-terminal domain-containing protein [Acidobacteriales bacterium]|nr:pilus assembly PilX N-terminal domain-containing protein [Terriglobales bacterium]
MRKHTHNNNERGVALIFVLFALLLLTAIGAGLMFMSDTESGININYRSEQRAYFAAMAGIQEARQRLTRPTSGGDLLAPPGLMLSTMPLAAAGTGVVYITNPRPGDPAIQPWTPNTPFFDTELCHELYPGLALATNTAPNIPCAQNAPAGIYYTQVASNMPGFAVNTPLDYKWVRITKKQNVSSAPFTVDGVPISNNFAPGYAPNGAVAFPAGPLNANTEVCFDGTRQILKPAGYVKCDDDPPPGTSMYKPVYVVTSLAVTPNGARRMLQMEVADTPPFLTNAALDTDDFIFTNGSSMTINGYDNCRCDCGTAKGGAVPNCKDRVKGGPCGGNTYAVFTSKEITSDGKPAIVAPTNPAAAENQVFPYDVPALIEAFKNQVGVVDIQGPPYNQVCSGSPSNCGNISAVDIGIPPTGFPTFDPANPTGLVNQITYVPGTIDLRDHPDGAGVLIVDGDLTIHGGMNFYGLILVKGVVTFIGGGAGQEANIFGSVVAGNGGVADNSLGGGVNIQYDRCALMNNQIVQPPATLSSREVTY